MKNSFYLVTPEQTNNEESLAFYEKEALSEWLSSLPTTSPSVAAQLFCDFVKQFNTIEMSAQQRLDVAEQLRPCFLKLKQSLYPTLNLSGFPKGEADKKTFTLLISLEKNLTIAYWLAVGELTHRGVNWLQGKSAALAIQRSIKGLSGIIISHHAMYLPTPDWVWLDLHSLYKLSLKIKKESTKISDETSHAGKGISSEESYIQILLFSLANPNGLMQKEVSQVYDLIISVSQLVKISQKPVDNQEAQCVISIDEDRQPFLTPSNNSRNVPTFFLNLSQLHKILGHPNKLSNRQLSRFEVLRPAKNLPEKMSWELLKYTINLWTNISTDAPPLFADRLDRHITIGLTNTHLSQSSLHTNTEEEIFAKSFSEQELATSHLREGILSIGSLVSYKKPDASKSECHLGIVKKITVPKLKGDIVFELSRLSQQVHAVTYSNINSSPQDEPNKALLYRKKSKSKTKTYILIEFYTYDNGDIIHLFFGKKDFNVVLGSKKCVGPGYWQFECRRVEKNKSRPKQTKINLILNYLFKPK